MTKSTGEVSLFERFKTKVEEFREELLTATAEVNLQSAQLTSMKHEHLYATLQEAFVIGCELMQPENAELLDQLLKQFHIERREGANPWMAVVNLLFVKRRKGKKGEWVVEVDKSAKKYAPAFYYMEQKKVIPEEAADYIKRFEYAKDKKLKALEVAGRDLRGGREPDEQEQFDQLNRLMTTAAVPLAVFDRDQLSTRAMQDGEFVLLWGRLIGRDVVVYGEVNAPKGNHSRITAYLYQAAKEAFAWTEKRVEKGMENGKGCMPPRRISPPTAEKLLEEERKRLSPKHMAKLAERAIKGGKGHPQNGDKTLAGSDQSDPAKPPKGRPARKGIKTGGNVKVESLTGQHKPMSRERIRELAVKLANDKRRSGKAVAA